MPIESFWSAIAWTPLILLGTINLVYFIALFLFAKSQQKFSWMDVNWGMIITLDTWVLFGYFFYIFSAVSPQGITVVILTTLWGVRLSYHLWKRNANKGEDPRYQTMKDRIHPPLKALKEFSFLFLPQAFLAMTMAITAWSTFVLNAYDMSLTPFLVIGITLWIIGFWMQITADEQLKAFTSLPENKGKLFTQGLWSLSRHPNYFGESMMWWGIGVLGFQGLFPWNGLLFISPLIITGLLLFVSGVPLSEKSMAKKPGYLNYKKSTSLWFPWFSKPSIDKK